MGYSLSDHIRNQAIMMGQTPQTTEFKVLRRNITTRFPKNTLTYQPKERSLKRPMK
jgi:hypothetical protein